MDWGAYYANLLIWQYRDKPKAYSLIYESVNSTELFDFYNNFSSAFNLPTAIGKQLRTLGQFIGLPNAFEVNNLSDTQYRQLLYMKIITNNTNSSEGEIVDALYPIFGSDLIMVSNNQMEITAYVNLPNALLELALKYNLIPRPMGVQMNFVNFNNVPIFFTSSSNTSLQIGLDTITGNGNSGLTTIQILGL